LLTTFTIPYLFRFFNSFQPNKGIVVKSKRLLEMATPRGWFFSGEKPMELKELTDRTLELFGVTAPKQLGPALLAACGDTDKLRQFRDLVDGDLSTDWMQKTFTRG